MKLYIIEIVLSFFVKYGDTQEGQWSGFQQDKECAASGIIQGFLATEQNEKQDQHANEMFFLRQNLWKSG